MIHHPPDALFDLGRSDPEVRAVLTDWRLERGLPEERLGPMLLIAVDAGDAVGAVDAGDAVDAVDAVGAVDAGGAGDAVGAGGRKILNQMLTTEPQVRTGLCVVQIPGGYYGYPITALGWLHRIRGDEFELVPGHRIVQRTGQWRMDGLIQLAAGKKCGYKFSDPVPMATPVHRLLVRGGPWAAVEKDFTEECPRPKGWVEAAD